MNNRENINPQLPLRDHVLTIENRRKAMVSGVRDVDSFNEQEVVFAIDDGIVIVGGRDLHISKLNLEEGQLIIEGEIIGMEYQEETQKSGLFSRLFK